MKKLVLVLLALPLAGCITPQQLQVTENNCRAVAAGQTGFYGGASNSLGAYQAYANDYYTCVDHTKFAPAYYGYGGYAYSYSYPYAYGYSYAYPYGYPYYYSGYYGPGVAVGVRGR